MGQTANLDNRISNAESMPMEGAEIDMARLKYKVEMPDGTERYITGANQQALIENAVKRGVELALAQFASQAVTMPGKQITLKDFIENEYKPIYFCGLAETTKVTQGQYLEKNIYPFLGNMLLPDITVKDIQNFYYWMAEGKKHGRRENLNRETIKRVSGLLGKIFKIAVAERYISENPVAKASATMRKLPGEPGKHHEALPLEKAQQARQRIPELVNERERLFMALLAYDTGMRPEEILGLRWEDINLEKGYLEIKRTVTYPDKNKPCLKDGGKTELSARATLVNPALVAILKNATDKTGYVIHGRTAEDIPCHVTYVRTYQKAFTALGLKGYSPYDWRSTFATELCEMGLTSKQVADMMGHSTTRMVETVYATKRREGIFANRDILNKKSEHYFSAS